MPQKTKELIINIESHPSTVPLLAQTGLFSISIGGWTQANQLGSLSVANVHGKYILTMIHIGNTPSIRDTIVNNGTQYSNTNRLYCIHQTFIWLLLFYQSRLKSKTKELIINIESHPSTVPLLAQTGLFSISIGGWTQANQLGSLSVANVHGKYILTMIHIGDTPSIRDTIVNNGT